MSSNLSVILIVARFLEVSYNRPYTLQKLHLQARQLDVIPAPDPASRRAVVSTLYDENYTLSLQVLGYSLQRANIQARRLLLYFPERISQKTLCTLQASGWETRPVETLKSKREGIPERYQDQFTKLRLWQQTDFDRLLYLDGDTIVTNNFDEVWDHPGDFAAVPDIWIGRGFTLDFNAGVLLLRPNENTFEELSRKMDTVQWVPDWAEQGFLNDVYRVHAHRLPVIYNANLAMRMEFPDMWNEMRQDFKIVHFTLVKPHWWPNDRNVQVGKEYEEIFKFWWKLKDEMDELNRTAVCEGP
ncbi:glycosyltransferase family 8 protein [Cystobasidium minutum MCA 4210]|uniref:glycosyltransferase family 8 protein n=1 Tax=Cystobasidium minutum MCA 4210 TaxID=1397322 RepID=UPI0034CE9DB9|eukprot:jgi/Rhomi1/193608/gm1.1822_g